MKVRRNPGVAVRDSALSLSGDELTLRSLRVNGEELPPAEYEASADGLCIFHVPDELLLETEVLLAPESNTKLMGLYTSSGTFCTQCEAEGFRRITYSFGRT